MLRKAYIHYICFSLFLGIAYALPLFTFASPTDGTIQAPNQYAWGENTGWINFAAPQGDVHVTDFGLTGYAWDANYGWINLNPGSAGVKNDGNGNLSGSAWSEGGGYINFSGVTINQNGKFSGQAQGTPYGRISFDCLSCNVRTDYRPANSTDRQSGGIIWLSGATTSQPYSAPVISVSPPVSGTSSLPQNIQQQIQQQEKPVTNASSSPELSELFLLLHNFPGFKEILTQLGVNVNDAEQAVSKMANVNFILPSFLSDSITLLNALGIYIPGITGQLSQTGLNTPGVNASGSLLQIGLNTQGVASSSLPGVDFNTQQLSLLKNIPLAQLPIQIKQEIPTEVVFARSGNDNIDLPITLNVTPDGQLNKSITVTANQRVTLFVKPDPTKIVDSIVGYVIFRSNVALNGSSTKNIHVADGTTNNLAAALTAQSTNVVGTTTPTNANDMMVVMQFNYTEDMPRDGIWTATIDTPSINGNYEIVTAINYHGIESPKVLRLVTVIDPEGYVYQAAGQNQTRIRNALITIYQLNPKTNAFETWDARSFSQKNPQLTDQTGEYSFLVPQGTYYFTVQATGYRTYTSQVFSAEDGDALHQDIEMIPSGFTSLEYGISLLLLLLILAYIARRMYEHYRRKRIAMYEGDMHIPEMTDKNKV